ncbi:MAG: hypothetical protein AABX11_01840 [Nanoarchaeota archaeon]
MSLIIQSRQNVVDYLISTGKIDRHRVAGQAVMHAHLYIIPRSEGDGLRFLTRV